MRNIHWALLAVALVLSYLIFGSAEMAGAEVISFSNRTDWQAVTKDVTTETFDSGFVKVKPSPISEESGPSVQQVKFESPLFSGKMVQDYSLSEVPGKTKTKVSYSLTSPATAFGFYINPQSTTTYDISISFGGESISLAALVPLGHDGFVGVITDAEPFKTIMFTLDNSKATKTTNFFYIMDDFSFGTAQ